jgi:hypothetical protein
MADINHNRKISCLSYYECNCRLRTKYSLKCNNLIIRRFSEISRSNQAGMDTVSICIMHTCASEYFNSEEARAKMGENGKGDAN